MSEYRQISEVLPEPTKSNAEEITRSDCLFPLTLLLLIIPRSRSI